MNQPAAYTPLESLFLFQSLLTHGVDSRAFAHVSELLRGNALIKAGDTYDPARLSPDALQHLFLLLLREELKSEAEASGGNGGSGGGGGGDGASRKRKLGSPPLPTLKDAYEHVEKVPALVDRLYARYRDHIVKQIRDDERAIEVVQREIQVLERSERERMARLAAQNGGAPALAPRDAKAPAGTKPKTQTPVPTPPASAAAAKKPIPNTPVLPPKIPTSTSSIAPPNVTPPSHLQAGTPPARPSQSPKPPHGPSSVLQAPASAPQQTPRVLQAPTQPPKPSISPRPESAKGEEAAAAPEPGAPASGSLKWEKPYQPPQTSPTPPSGQFQSPVPPPSTAPPAWTQPQQQTQPPTSAQGTPQPSQQQARPTPPNSGLVPPQNAGQVPPPLQPGPRPTGTPVPPPARPQSTTPVIPPSRPLQPQQGQPAQQPRPIASASPTPPTGATGPSAPPQKWQQSHPPQQQAQRPSPSASPGPGQKDKPYSSPYIAQPPRPPIPEHMIRQAAGTPGPARRFTGTIPMPQTPVATSPGSLTRGMGTKWASQSTPSTPNPLGMEPESPAFEPVSPPLPAVAPPKSADKAAANQPTPKSAHKTEAPATRPSRGRPSRNAQKTRGTSATPSAPETRRSQSVASHVDDLALDHPAATPKIKDEYSTPRPQEETGDTTADESVQGRAQHVGTPRSLSSRFLKRKRQDTPLAPSAPAAHVLWTRGFTKVSSSALDQVSGHRDANMFATALRERDAPGYRSIVLQPQDITSIRSAIKHGNKAAVQAANSLPGGDPGTTSVWLPVSEDLVPPKGIINSAHLERELVHMFSNAIMYNPDPDRGPGPAFMRRAHDDDEEDVVGYRLDENGVVKNTQSMFLQVEKLLGDLRSAEKERSVPPPTSAANTRPGSVATPATAAAGPAADDTAEDEDELAGDGDGGAAAGASGQGSSGTVKRRRIGTRG